MQMFFSVLCFAYNIHMVKSVKVMLLDQFALLSEVKSETIFVDSVLTIMFSV